ncbi:sugar kinase [Roseobacter sp. HKCCD9010]|uniref:sugar kinase n=1 Tax=unclassified Roseobacter TaxID=196798 RepID=UPI0014916DF0|nr:sugar kinase [Rhodobacterales bacterium HKCCD4356]NNV12832.1 sugar kinase [Roseobacter sp. HKCCD7357]NNV16777.1 sugar kinase [Roseobacter sp. HKCCD8768]NNV26591.1 sugar kinase [Roseobacter sp. HKCCD8192]NNV30497.1 sugar kinase [Roseobacter sp. HKCCD9061]NNV34667.1 sugar kinase [Roseobacter sp. HKCCD9073]NNV39369.1 sugar kinase [Roseobacter sp. HKCCD9054]NNV42873.1 sugar kinase [Roseobacter sp. HKCCD6497]NNV47557.1 sugar kinase [Roseobacter sp. HKCCD6265]NNV51686.1 sugar kinase [Roseobac
MPVDILALGEPLAEFVAQPSDEDASPLYRQGFGGDTSNALVAAARQGASVGYLSAVGDDPFGRGLRKLWADEGIDDRHVITRPDAPTGVYFVRPHASGREFWYARRGSAASLYGPDDLPEAAIAEAKILHVTALSQAISPSMRAAVTRAAEIARAHDTLVSYDTNLRLNLWSLDDARAAIDAFLPLADIVMPSDDEAELLTGLQDPEALIAYFQAQGAKIVLLKRGASGAILEEGGGPICIAPGSSSPVDSTGAGDSFAGAFLAYFLETGSAEVAARRAALVAAQTVSGYGAISPIPRRDELIDLL